VSAELKAQFVLADLPGKRSLMDAVDIWDGSDIFCMDSRSKGIRYFAFRTCDAVGRLSSNIHEVLEWSERT
jgi:hypothetical protein